MIRLKSRLRALLVLVLSLGMSLAIVPSAWAAGTTSVLNQTPSPYVRITNFQGTNAVALCSGTLIDPTHVLTAAHCFTLTGADTAAVFAATTPTSDELYYRASAINTKSVALMGWGDMALITLTAPIPNTTPASLNLSPIELGTNPQTVTAYGRNLLDATGTVYLDGNNYAYTQGMSQSLVYCASNCMEPAIPNAALYGVKGGTWSQVESRNPGTGMFLQSAGYVNHGDSGGGVFVNGKMVGVLFGGDTASGTVLSTLFDGYVIDWLRGQGVAVNAWQSTTTTTTTTKTKPGRSGSGKVSPKKTDTKVENLKVSPSKPGKGAEMKSARAAR